MLNTLLAALALIYLSQYLSPFWWYWAGVLLFAGWAGIAVW